MKQLSVTLKMFDSILKIARPRLKTDGYEYTCTLINACKDFSGIDWQMVPEKQMKTICPNATTPA